MKTGEIILIGLHLAILFFFMLGMITSASAQIQIGDGGQEAVILQTSAPPDVLGNGTFNQTLTDRIYWRRDGTNAPPTASWDMGGFNFNNVGTINFDSLGSPAIYSSPLQLLMSADIMTFNGDTTNFGAGIGNVQTSWKGQTTGVMVWNGLSTDRFFDFQAGANFDNNVTFLENILVSNSIFINESLNVSGDIFAQGYINSSDKNINIADRTNISWDLNGGACLHWEGGASSSDSRICSPISSRLDLTSNEIRLQGATVTVGRGAGVGSTTSLNFDNPPAANDDALILNGASNQWIISYPLAWDFGSFPSAVGLIFNSHAPQRNVTWNSLTGTGMVWTSPDLTFDIPNQVYSTSDFCITGGNCLSDMSADVVVMNTSFIAKERTHDVDLNGSWYGDHYLRQSLNVSRNYTFTFNILTDNTNDGINFNVTYSGEADITWGLNYNFGSSSEGGYCDNCGYLGQAVDTNDGFAVISGAINPATSGEIIMAYREDNDLLAITKVMEGSNMIIREVLV